MAVAPTQTITTNHRPMIAKVRSRAFYSRSRRAFAGVAITHFDDQNRIVGASLCDLDTAERFARDLLAIVAAARMAGDIGPAAAPRTETVLMDGLTQYRPPIAPAEPAVALGEAA